MNKPITFLLNEVVWQMNQHADKYLKQTYDISFNWFLLMATLQSVQPVNQHALARCLNYSDAAVSKLISKIAEAGLVSITTDPQHGRKNSVMLTSKGSKVVDGATVYLENAFREMLVASQIDVVEFGHMLGRIEHQLQRGKL